MDDTLQEVLRDLMRSPSAPNAALDLLIDDYRTYHLVLVVVSALLLAALVVVIIFFARCFARAPRNVKGRWSFEKKTYLCFGILSILVGLFMALVVAANVSTVVNPRSGFSGSIGMLGSPDAGTPLEALQRPVSGWLQSGTGQPPAELQAAVDERLSWQRPKALVSSVLFVAVSLLTAFVWRALIRRSRNPGMRWRGKESGLLLMGTVGVIATLVLMLMVMGNTQAAIAPVSMTLFFG